ncbi:MAG TPA: LacI family DNA-binding transcriptional regulator [Anaerolineales bacterium]|nr:LacI family DNA-binding transcriptional regulator [Anaerolineales bacterium]
MLDVANRAKVSLSTVSYALNGTRPISEETRQRIAKAMEELGYRPHPLARGLASKHTRILAILFPAVERGLGITELDFVASAAHAASTNGYHLVVWSAETNDPSELRELTQQGLVDGVILMEVHVNDQRVNLLREIGFPFSMIGRCDDDRDGYVDIAFKQTINEALSHLTGLGHRNIAFLNQSQASYEAGYGPVVRTKVAFEEYIRASGVNGVMRFCLPSPQAGYQAFNALLKEHPELTAIISMNDRALPGVMRAISEREWKIPDDFSLVALVSSVRMAEMMVPTLTTMEPPSAELGRIATELLINHLEGKGDGNPRILIPCRLVVGESSGPCRRNSSNQG